ncbi:MAG: hypothetical protein R2724_20135 [Bryobacterales bacterium]
MQPETVAIVGDGDLAAETAHEIAYRRDLRMHIAGFIALRPLDVASPRARSKRRVSWARLIMSRRL